MKYTKLDIAGRTMHLYCNAAACFEIYDAFGYDKNIIELLQAPGSVGYGNTLRIAAILAGEGELSRRWEGHAPQDAPTADELCRIVTPTDFVKLKRAATEAVRQGFAPTVEDKTKPRYRDKGLEKLEKAQKKTPSAEANISTS